MGELRDELTNTRKSTLMKKQIINELVNKWSGENIGKLILMNKQLKIRSIVTMNKLITESKAIIRWIKDELTKWMDEQIIKKVH